MRKTLSSMLLALLAFASCAAWAAESDTRLLPAPINRLDVESLQRGARNFVNYCLTCHSAKYMRYNRLADLDLTDAQITGNLMFATDKIGQTMTVAMSPANGKAWFGNPPPDLSVEARIRGREWLYSYLLGFYRDDKSATGWNNLVFPNVGMPNVLWELQGQHTARFVEQKDARDEGASVHRFAGFETIAPGKLSEHDFDEAVADLVAYLQWMGEPVQHDRVRVGVWVLIFLALFTFIAWRLNAAFWKDVK